MKRGLLIFFIFSLTFNFFPDEENRLKKNQFEKENATIYHGKILNQESQDFQVIAFHLQTKFSRIERIKTLYFQIVIYYTYELQAKKYLFPSAYTFFFGAEYCSLDSGR